MYSGAFRNEARESSIAVALAFFGNAESSYRSSNVRPAIGCCRNLCTIGSLRIRRTSFLVAATLPSHSAGPTKTDRAHACDGIAPKPPPLNGRAPSKSHLRQRLRTHYFGNAAGSTLRRTLGCLLSDQLAIQMRRVGSGGRYTFTNPDEQLLDEWMKRHAFVTWTETNAPWALEKQLLSSGLRLPLNLDG
jgi:hypothetical protein